jgi:hypothetical protein
MSARYHVLASDALMAMDDLRWPEGLRPVEQEPADPGRYPGMHWWLFEDDDAPPELDGEQVELSFRTIVGDDGTILRNEITDRSLMRPAP